jgi:oligopeptide/dipeptide ABC transporter ATP-binding protein
MPLLKVENITTTYPVGKGWFGPLKHLHAVRDVSFHIEKGETLGLVGESGCGKSSLGRTLIRLEKAQSGKAVFDRTNIFSLNSSELRKFRRRFQMIFQDPYASLNPRMSVRSAIDEVLRVHSALSKEQRERRLASLLEMVGLDPSHADRYPHQFSGGQRQRICIARALAVEPDLIVADEPVSSLDVSVQAQIINLLQEIQNKTGIAYLFIAHDLAVVEHISRRIMVMYLGRIVEIGESRSIIRNPAHPYTMALISAVPAIDRGTGRKRIILPGDVPSPLNPPKGCPFHPRCPAATGRCSKEEPPLALSMNGKEHYSACFYRDDFYGKMSVLSGN